MKVRQRMIRATPYQFGVGQHFQQGEQPDAVLKVLDQVIHSKRWNALQKNCF